MFTPTGGWYGPNRPRNGFFGFLGRWRWPNTIATRARRAQAAFAARGLAPARQRCRLAERLIDELWGESPPATVAKSVQVYVSRLRKQLSDGRLLTRTPGYLLQVDPTELDVARFERLVAEAGSADADTAAQKLREALALWRGPPLADLAYEPFAQAESARLGELRLAALEQRIDADLATGRHAELAG